MAVHARFAYSSGGQLAFMIFHHCARLALFLAMTWPLALWAQTEPPHPILSIPGSGSGADAVLSTYTEAQYTNNFVPRQSPRNNDFGFVPPVVSGDTGWSWSASNPNQITSTPSGTVFPNANPAYPILSQAVSVISGKTVNVPYYNRAGGGGRSLVFALIDHRKRGQLRGDLNKLAPAYMNSGSSHATRNQAYARRIAIALLDWARWFPDYYMTGKNSATFINASPSYILPSDLQRASDHNGLAHEWSDDELLAFDAIYDSGALAQLSTEMGFDVRGYIKTNLFCNEGDFIVYHVPVDVATDSNLSGPYTVLALVARVLNRPDYIAWMDSYLNTTVREKIRRDGTLSEGVAYSVGYINENLGAARNTRDYFLSRAADTAALQAISNRVGSYVTTLQYGQAQWHTVRLPNGELPSFGDTTFGSSNTRNAGTSSLLPAYGTLCVGTGSGSQSVQLNQNFSGDNNHMRSDTTAFVLWAFNSEILGNIRYHNGTPGRQFTEQILAYNAVTIDRADMNSPDADTYGNGDLTLYEPGNNGLAVTEIDGQRAYSSRASRYQRIMLLNTADLGRPYVVDVFRVTGGATHDYVLHGSIRFDQTWECSFPLATNPATYPMLEGTETWVEPTSSGSSFPYYGFWRNVNSNQAPGNFQITYRDTAASNRDLRLWMTDDGTARVYIGRTPVPSRANGEPDNYWENNLWRPSSIIRKRVASGPLANLFVSVIEPLGPSGNSTIQSIERLPMAGNPLEACGLKITFTDGRVDTYLVNLRNPQVAGASGGAATISSADGRYVLNGRMGAHMDLPAGPGRVWTVHATDFQYPNRRLSTPTNIYFSGLISGETRRFTGASNDVFITTTPLPTGTALRNQQLAVTFGALSGSGTTGISEMFRIDQVLFTNGQYQLVFTNDHMMEITNGTATVEKMAPLRTFSGSNAFEIVLSASAAGISPLADIVIPVNGTSGPVNFSYGNLGSTAGASLQVLASSSDSVLVPGGGLVIAGSGTARSLTVTPATNQAGVARITVSVTDGVWTNSRSFNVLVSDFIVTATPSAWTVPVSNTNLQYTINVSTNGNFSGEIVLGISGLPANTTAGFNPPMIIGAGSSLLSVGVSNTTPPGTYPLRITASHGGLTNWTEVSLTIGRGVANLLWASTGSTAWDVTNSLNWFNPALGVADRFVNGDSVLFDDTAGLVSSVNLGATVLPSSVTNDSSSRNYTISGAGAISGAASIVKKGSSTLTLGTANDFSGLVRILGGTVKAGNSAALGATSGSTSISNGAALDVNGLSLGGEPIVVSGTGPSSAGAIVNSGPQITTALRNVTLAGDAFFGGTGRWDIRNTGGTASLLCSGQPLRIVKVGTNQVSLVGVNPIDAALGDIEVQQGVFAIQTSTTQVGDPTKTIMVLPGAALNLWSLSGTPLNKRIVLQNGATVWNESGNSVVVGPITLTNGVAVFNVAGTLTLSNNVINGPGGLTKTGAGTLTLRGSNTFAGATLVSSGPLALAGAGALGGTTRITVMDGAMLDLTGRADGRLLLQAGQQLSGNGTVLGSLQANAGSTVSPGLSIGALTVTNAVTLRGTTFIELNKASNTNDVLRGASAIQYGGTLALTNLAGALVAGDSFNVFGATVYSGGFTNVTPGQPAPGLAWDLSGLTNGTLRVVAAPQPSITAIGQANGGLVISGNNGIPHAQFYVLASTNLGLPLGNWTRIATNTFSATGGFNLTNEIEPGVLQRFYLIQIP